MYCGFPRTRGCICPRTRTCVGGDEDGGAPPGGDAYDLDARMRAGDGLDERHEQPIRHGAQAVGAADADCGKNREPGADCGKNREPGADCGKNREQGLTVERTGNRG